MPRPCLDAVDSIYKTSLSLASGMSLLRVWSATTSALKGPFRQGPWHPVPAFPRSSVLCCARGGFSWSPHPPCQAPRKAVSSGNECYFKEVSPIKKNHKWVTFPETFAALLPTLTPTPACSLEQSRLMIFLAAYTECDCFCSGLWLYISISGLEDLQSQGGPRDTQSLGDAFKQHPTPLPGSCPGHPSS